MGGSYSAYMVRDLGHMSTGRPVLPKAIYQKGTNKASAWG